MIPKISPPQAPEPAAAAAAGLVAICGSSRPVGAESVHLGGGFAVFVVNLVDGGAGDAADGPESRHLPLQKISWVGT